MQIPVVKNPLSVIALFVTLIEAFLSFPVTQLAGTERMIMVQFMTTFPFFVAAGFFIMLWFRPSHLYNPQDIPSPLQDLFQANTKREVAKEVAAQIQLDEIKESESTKVSQSVSGPVIPVEAPFGPETENLSEKIKSADFKDLESKILDKLPKANYANEDTIRQLKKDLQKERRQKKERIIEDVKDVISGFMKYLIQVGFTDLPNVEKVIVESADFINIYYEDSTNKLHIGESLTGDGSGISHAYFSSITSKRWKWDKSPEQGAILTAFQDYFACSFCNDSCFAHKTAIVAKKYGWDSVGECVRNLSESVTIKNVTEEPHDKSRPLSSALWELREKYGQGDVDSAVCICIKNLPEKLTFNTTATSLVETISNKTSKPKPEIEQAFTKRGFQLSEVPDIDSSK